MISEYKHVNYLLVHQAYAENITLSSANVCLRMLNQRGMIFKEDMILVNIRLAQKWFKTALSRGKIKTVISQPDRLFF